MSEILASVKPSYMRRSFGVAALVMLGALLIYIALTKPPASLGWVAFLLGFGGLMIFGAHAMWRASAHDLILTREALMSGDGRVVAKVADIRSADRSLFAFKPSNGFLLRLNVAEGRAWAPGIWWRVGRRVGVGGVTTASEAKFMAEVLTALIAERDQSLDT